MDLFGKRENQKLKAKLANSEKKNRFLQKELAKANESNREKDRIIGEQQEVMDNQVYEIAKRGMRILDLEERHAEKDAITNVMMADALRHGSPEAGRQMGYKSAEARKKRKK